MLTWKRLIASELKMQGETWDDIESITLSEDELAAEFNPDSSTEEGKPFTAWTARRVYFPMQHGGLEWVGSVSRIPDGKPTEHLGG
jgi:hypothetical protein